jgi:hypothetical protein
MSKPWTKCRDSRGDAVWYTQNLARFAAENDLEKSTCYSVRKGKVGFKSHRGWVFGFVAAPPIGGRVFEWRFEEQKTYQTDEKATLSISEAMDFVAPEPESDGDDPVTAGVDTAIASLGDLSLDAIKQMAPVEKYRALSTIIMEMALNTVSGNADYPVGWRPKDLTSVLDAYAKAWNIDPKKAMDLRSDADKVLDGSIDILREGARIFEQVDTVIKGLEQGMSDIHDNAVAVFDRFKGDNIRADNLLDAADLISIDPMQVSGEPPSPKVIREAAKRWINRFRRVRHLAEQARDSYPTGADRSQRIIGQATHVLRYQLYAGRPDIDSATGSASVYQFADIHVKAAFRLWLARNECDITEGYGVVERGDIVDGAVFEGVRYIGTLIMMPPRHGKTDLVIHDIAQTICERPRIQMAIIHDKVDEASKVLRAASNLLNRDTSQGRRTARLYPGIELAEYDNNSTTLRVCNENPPRNPNLMATSIWASGQGNNLDRLYGDDLVPQSDMTEANKREQRKTRFAGTWLSRLQGREWDVVLTGYPRHHEDLMWTWYREAMLSADSGGREGMKMMCLRLPVGGRRSKVPFHAIWPAMYPEKELAAKYRQLNDASLWAANYMLEPITNDQRIVEKVRYFDPESEQIQMFLKSATYHLSVDPAAKGDGTGDKAGVVVGAIGDILTIESTDGGDVVYEEKMLLVVHAEEFYATQTQLTEHMLAMCSRYPIDTAHIEQVTGLGSAMAEALETHYGIDRVMLHGVANKGKAARLRAVAPVIEASDPTLPAKVALAGERLRDEEDNIIEGSPLECAKPLRKLDSYIKNFAVESGYHSLDAFTQMVGHLVKTGDLAVHQGVFAQQTSNSLYLTNKTRKLKRLQAVAQSYAENQDEEYAWFGEANNYV